MKKNVIASDQRECGNLIVKIVIASVAWQSQHVYKMRLLHHFVSRNDKCNCAPRKEGVEK